MAGIDGKRVDNTAGAAPVQPKRHAHHHVAEAEPRAQIGGDQLAIKGHGQAEDPLMGYPGTYKHPFGHGQKHELTPEERKAREVKRIKAPASAQAVAAADAVHEIARLPYTGGAPALHRSQMDESVIKSNVVMRFLYGLPEGSTLQRVGLTTLKVLGPLGAVANVGVNILNAVRIFRDPNSNWLLKTGVTASTALATASAGMALRLGAAAFNVAPMAGESLKFLGKLSGLTGLGAGAILSGIDTYYTFKNPESTAAERGFSTLATVSSIGLTAAVALGVCTGPLGWALMGGAIGFSLLKGFAGKTEVANQAFSAVGKALSYLKFW